MHIYSFEKLEVWQLSKELVRTIYIITKNFPREELFGLTSQMRRASVSVSSNLAEGTSRVTPKDKARFTVIAYSSIVELLNQVILSFELGYLSKEVYEKIRFDIAELTNKMNALHKAQLRNIEN